MHYPCDEVKVRESFFYHENLKNDLKLLSIGDIHLSKLVDLCSVDK